MRPIKRAIRTFTDMDKVLFFTSLILIVFGSLNIVTASSREAVVNADANMFYYFFKHVIILIISLVAFIIVLRIETKDYKKWLPFIYIVVFGLNLFLILKGVATRGANNWINLGFMKIQPSELAKPTLILAMSLLFRKNYYKLKDPKEKHDMIIWQIIGFGLIFPAIVFLQKDLGTAMILFGIFAVMYIFSPITKSEKIKASLISLGAIAILLLVRLSISGYILSDAQTSRLKNFFNPCSKYEDTGYQVCNAFILTVRSKWKPKFFYSFVLFIYALVLLPAYSSVKCIYTYRNKWEKIQSYKLVSVKTIFKVLRYNKILKVKVY